MSYLDEISEIWRIVYQQIALEKTNSFAELWYKDLKIHSYENDVITFATDSQFKYDKIKATHLPELERAFSSFLLHSLSAIAPPYVQRRQNKLLPPQKSNIKLSLRREP